MCVRACVRPDHRHADVVAPQHAALPAAGQNSVPVACRLQSYAGCLLKHRFHQAAGGGPERTQQTLAAYIAMQNLRNRPRLYCPSIAWRPVLRPPSRHPPGAEAPRHGSRAPPEAGPSPCERSAPRSPRFAPCSPARKPAPCRHPWGVSPPCLSVTGTRHPQPSHASKLEAL
jgi:hypothetical protein